jgi:hypothetical protein
MTPAQLNSLRLTHLIANEPDEAKRRALQRERDGARKPAQQLAPGQTAAALAMLANMRMNPAAAHRQPQPPTLIPQP